MSESGQQNQEEAKEQGKRRSLRRLRSQLSTASTLFGGGVFVMQRTRFEVRVPGLSSKEEVRMSGNVPVLGEWDLQRSVVMSRWDGLRDTWCVEVEIPVDLTVEYRYLVVRRVVSGDKELVCVNYWETTIHPRQICLRKMGAGKTEGGEEEEEEEVDDGSVTSPSPVIRQDGVFGETESGEKAKGEGWLVGTSELQLQLHNSEAPPIRLDTLPGGQIYSVKVRNINYCAKTHDVCEVCQCTPINVKVLDRDRGDCEVREQGEHGVPCLPHQMLVFFTEAPSYQYCAFIVDLYSVAVDGKEHVGRASILPQHIEANAGKIVLTVFSPQLLPIGTITFTYLVIHPAKELARVHRTRYSYANYWKKHKRPLDVGHRGLGDSFHAKTELKPSATENTIASLRTAGAHGADYVEFDVQLTRDRVPVVYHDFTVCTTLARQGFLSGELYLVFVKDLTLSQLHHLKLDHSSVLGLQTCSAPSSTHTSPYTSDSESPSSSCTSPTERNKTLWGPQQLREIVEEEGPECRTFPTLEQVFKGLPSHIGFNIEVKYPIPKKENPQFNFHYFERNMMADIILQTVYRHAHKRKIIFSCFDPGMCSILRRKQPKYPVLFLSSANDSSDPDVPVDVRARGWKDAMMFAKAEKLLGVDIESSPVLRSPRIIQDVVDKKLVLFTWGKQNNNPHNILRQKKLGVAAVIYDRITHMIPPRKNVFQMEQEEKEERAHKRTTVKLY